MFFELSFGKNKSQDNEKERKKERDKGLSQRLFSIDYGTKKFPS